MFSSNVRNQWVPPAHNVPPVPHSPLGREKRREERQLQRPPQLTQIPRPWLLCLVKSLVKYSSQGTTGTIPSRLQRGLSASAGGPGIQHTRSWLYAWARGRTTIRMNIVDQVMSPQRWDSHEGTTHLPVQTINSLFPKRASCWVELQSGSTVFLRPDTTVPSGVSLVFWGEFFTFFNFCLPFSGLKVPLLMNWGLSSRDLVWPNGPSIPRASPAEEAR